MGTEDIGEKGKKDKIDKVIEKAIENLGGLEPWPGKQDSGRPSRIGQVSPNKEKMKSGHSGGHRNPLGKKDIPND